ncbi:MAG: hypothetical protein ACTSVB_00815 [Candidatus Heimdallarchaeaceae archaeon]
MNRKGANVDIVDKTGQPRSDDDLIEARTALEKELISMKNFGPILIYYPTIIEAINELLKRRKE